MVDLKPSRASDPIFDLQTQALGRLVIENLIVKHLESIEKVLAERGDTSANDLIDIFISTLARTENGDPLTSEQIGSILVEEKEDFAEQLLNACQYMYRKRSPEAHDSDYGEATVNDQKGDITIEREKNESAIPYFYRVFFSYMESWSNLFKSVKLKGIDASLLKSVSGWVSPSTLSALRLNAQISDQLAKSLSSARMNDAMLRWDRVKASDALTRLNDMFKPDDSFSRWKDLAKLKDEFADLKASINAATSLSQVNNVCKADPLAPKVADTFAQLKTGIPPNPIHGTNERLDGLIERFDHFEAIAEQTGELVHSMNTAALGLLESFANGARDTEKFSRRSILIAVLALGVAILTPIIQNMSDGQQKEETKHLIENAIQQIINSEQKASDTVRSVISERPNRPHTDDAELAKAISSLSAEIRALREQSFAHHRR